MGGLARASARRGAVTAMTRRGKTTTTSVQSIVLQSIQLLQSIQFHLKRHLRHLRLVTAPPQRAAAAVATRGTARLGAIAATTSRRRTTTSDASLERRPAAGSAVTVATALPSAGTAKAPRRETTMKVADAGCSSSAYLSCSLQAGKQPSRSRRTERSR